MRARVVAGKRRERGETAGAAHVICVGTAEDALAALRADPRFDVAVLDAVLGALASR